MKAVVWMHIITLFLIVVAALNLSIYGILKVDVLEAIFGRFAPIVYIAIGIAAVIHIFSRDYYLSFLGHCAFPCGSLVERAPENHDSEVTIKVAPNCNVIYWAAEAGEHTKDNPWIAYDKYANAGVAVSDDTGNATLRFRYPSAYTVGFRRIPSHVHYRVCQKYGLLSRVETVQV